MKKAKIFQAMNTGPKVLLGDTSKTTTDQLDRENFENELTLREERLKLALKASGLGTFDWHVSDDDAIWDKRMHEIFGLAEDSDENRNDYFFSVLHPDCLEAVQDTYAKLLTGGNEKTTFESNYKIVRGEEVRYISAHGFLFLDEHGIVNRIIGTANDFTEQRQAKDALQKSEMQYRALVENSQDLIWELDQKGNFIFINSAAEKIYGLASKELIGAPFTKNMNEECAAKAVKLFIRALNSAKQLSHFECKVLNTKGEFVILDSHIVVHRDEEGEIVAITGSSQDITKRKKAEEEFLLSQKELTETTERLLLSTEAARVGIFEWNMINDELIWDKTMFELYDIPEAKFSEDFKKWSNAVHPDDLPEAMEKIDLVMKGAKVFDATFRVIWPDESVHFIKALAKTQFNEKGEAIRMVGANWDITKEKEVELQKLKTQQLEVKNKELEKFAYVASHDLKEPLRTMKSFAQLLEMKYSDKLDENGNKYLNFISQAASRMERMVKVLLSHSKIGQNTEVALIDCQAIIDDLSKDLGTLISETKVTFEIDPLPIIKGYEMEMRMIFQNLLANAIKFRKKGTNPVIKISAERQETQWEFCVADNGIGIELEFKEKIFSLVQKLHSAQEYEGVGIGLAHCQKIVDLHGGRIWVESEFGVGSSFYFTIPFVPSNTNITI